ncbi:divalent-cation tolerance protein CutA [Marinicella rhabdoformis]|uniref:divalent-cation tolerance protein CutA n=1 Tax=Marinicella rhabdoformis TaxID=2580566 RepID=UPI0012AEC5F5|nr:divalent-cation tolerance protein CutA [Marinicella rhabdoformis]
MSEEKYIQVTVSCSSDVEAVALVKLLLSQRLVACGQIIDSMQSFYRWQGQIASANECLLLLKTKEALFERIEQEILTQHSYDVPEIIATPLVALSKPYKKWIDEETI